MQASQPLRTRFRVVSATLVLLLPALASCGEDASPPPGTSSPGPSASPHAPKGETATAEGRPASGAGASDVPTPGVASVRNWLKDFGSRGVQPFAVSGKVAVGGRVWRIPPTVFAVDTAAGRPSLRWCTAVGLAANGGFVRDSRKTGWEPYLSLLFGSQERPDQSAGDYVSGAFDGSTLTGGAYDHNTGEEWAWSVKGVRVDALPLEIADGFILARVSWAGDAGENFSAQQGSVKGSVTCLLSTAETVERYVNGEVDAERLKRELVALAPKAARPFPLDFKNCTALNKRYPHGVGMKNARDETSGKPVTDFERDTKFYREAMSYNKGLDRDKDGIACEKA